MRDGLEPWGPTGIQSCLDVPLGGDMALAKIKKIHAE